MMMLGKNNIVQFVCPRRRVGNRTSGMGILSIRNEKGIDPTQTAECRDENQTQNRRNIVVFGAWIHGFVHAAHLTAIGELSFYFMG